MVKKTMLTQAKATLEKPGGGGGRRSPGKDSLSDFMAAAQGGGGAGERGAGVPGSAAAQQRAGQLQGLSQDIRSVLDGLRGGPQGVGGLEASAVL
mmetsp:Transcript_4320/g.7692  ORF Transcript_4320/g.7692 Transcript_4320/m.7692 type:complete len:95 (+) Transcript_4320:1365-1649(+)